MALPEWLFRDNFASGDATGWTAETDVNGVLDIAHYTTLARHGSRLAMPYSGAYALRVEPVIGVASNSFLTSTDVAIANGEQIWVKFNMYINADIFERSTANDSFRVFELRQVSNAYVWFLGGILDVSAETVTIQVGSAGSAPNTGFTLPIGEWFTVEIQASVDTGAATADMHLYITPDGSEPSSTPLYSLSNQATAAVTYAMLGTNAITSGNQGIYLYNNFVATVDGGERIWPDKDRFSTTKTLTYSDWAFLGPGRVSGVTLNASNDTDCAVTIYDTDTAQAHGAIKKCVLKNIIEYETIEAEDVPFEVTRGCYVEIEGSRTTKEVEVTIEIDRAQSWFSDDNIRRHALKRKV